jgi:prepilin-type N-terminal cleavage/methylation domain-containing protein
MSQSSPTTTTQPIKWQAGVTLVEILIAMIVASLGVAAFLQTIKPTISANKSNRQYVDMSGALSEILDSSMTQPVATLDGMNGAIFKSRQGVNVRLTVAPYTQSAGDAILLGLDVSRMRKLTVVAVLDSLRSLSATVSNYQEVTTGKCYTR